MMKASIESLRPCRRSALSPDTATAAAAAAAAAAVSVMSGVTRPQH